MKPSQVGSEELTIPVKQVYLKQILPHRKLDPAQSLA